MNFLPTQWWFRSRQSGRLNTMAYVLLTALLSLPLYLAIGFAFQLSSALDETDWITGRPPKAVKLAAAQNTPFYELRSELVAKLAGSKSVSNHNLYPASDLTKCGDPEPSVRKGEKDVYPKCVTYVEAPADNAAAGRVTERSDSAREKDAVEKAVFERFAAYITTRFAEQGKQREDQQFLERRLARALGLVHEGSARDPLDVPWIYVASERGAIAVFPGTKVIIEKDWNTKSRPWYQAIFEKKPQLSTDPPHPQDRLSVTYLDVLAESSILVRTYLHHFTVNGQNFALGIDLKRRHESLGGGSMGGPPPSTWTDMPLSWRAAITLGISLVILWILRRMTAVKARFFCFERTRAKYGIVQVESKTQAFVEEIDRHGLKWGAGGGDYVWVRGEQEQQKSHGTRVDTIASISRPVLRGQEIWAVSSVIRVTWQLFGWRFESTRRIRVGDIELAYTRAILPDTSWLNFNQSQFSTTQEHHLRQRLTEILRHHADGASNGHLEIPADSEDVIPPTSLKVPDWALPMVNSHELLALRQHRAYVTVTSATLKEMYDNADLVRAVILPSYLERLLEQGETDFLLRGRTVQRLIAFPDSTAQLRLSAKSRAAYKEFLNAFAPPSRVLGRVDCPTGFEGITPVYDFALIKDSEGERVLVAHRVSEASIIDIASPHQTTQMCRVEGYLSWRKADVRFYSALFESLVQQSREIRHIPEESAAAQGAA